MPNLFIHIYNANQAVKCDFSFVQNLMIKFCHA